MARTPEQKAADDALTEAIERCAKAYADDDQASRSWVMSEYVVLFAQHRYDDDGDGVTAVGVVYRDGDVAPHRALGLVEYAAVRMRAFIAED